jgi:hypothetical protein
MSDNNACSMEMPRYKSHKTVWALKIENIKADVVSEIYELEFYDKRYSKREVTLEWLEKHEPVPGGYFVVYKGGYSSFSPADAFESGNSLIE